ncbi:MAG: hypothetical protein ABGX16_12495 [Pirellulales bacterium]
MVELRLISKSGIPAALRKATRYRLLNEPLEAESICRDVLAVDPENQEAILTLLLAMTDVYDKELAGDLNNAKQLLPKIKGEYERTYYEGIINERWGNAQLSKSGHTSVGWYRAAIRCYAKAEELSEPDNDDAVLRWNSCVRIMKKYDFTPESMTRDVQGEYGDDVPLR